MEPEQLNKKVRVIILSIFFALSLVGIIFGVLCVYTSSLSFLKNHALLSSVIVSSLIIAICVFSAYAVIKNWEKIIKSLLVLFIFLAFVLVFLFILQKTGFFSVINDTKRLQEWLQKSGAWMPILYILLQYLQVVILPIPTFVSTAAGVALFGPFKTLLFSYVGVVLGSFTAFYIGRKLGYKAVSWIVGEVELKKWQEKLKGKDNFFLTVMFLLPFFPDDVLCFIAGLSSMTDKYFFWMLLITRAIGISSTSYTLNFIPFTTWWGLLIWAGLILIVGVGVYIAYKNLDKIQGFFKRKKD